jgi:hypothetical protein
MPDAFFHVAPLYTAHESIRYFDVGYHSPYHSFSCYSPFYSNLPGWKCSIYWNSASTSPSDGPLPITWI